MWNLPLIIMHITGFHFCYSVFGMIIFMSLFLYNCGILILAPTIPKEDDVAVILEPEPSPRVPEESPATVRPVPTSKISLPLRNEVS